MPKFLVSVCPWDTPRVYTSDLGLGKSGKVIVASDCSNEIGIVEEIVPEQDTQDVAGKILRVATERDKCVSEEHETQKKELLEICRQESRKLNLEMKLVDAMISLDGKQVFFAFTSDGRVDFRELVKTLSSAFKKSIRMHQIGSRDEARRAGGYGICGREVCCVRFRGKMQSITTDMARSQQIAHRGTERISGLCGRLMCCLAYEAGQYKEMLKGMPELYSSIETASGKGTVIEINAALQEVKVKLENGKYLTVGRKELAY